MKRESNKLTAAEYRELIKPKAKPVAKWGAPVKLSESQQQAQCVEWFRSEYPQFAKCLFAIPNGGKRSKREAAQFVREGVLAGIPDTFLALPRKSYHGLFIELKTATGKPTERQLEMMAILSVHNYRCEVVYSTEQFQEVITNYLNAA